MTTLPRRLARLEQMASSGAAVYVWQDAGADVIERQFPEGVPEGITVVVYRWADPERPDQGSSLLAGYPKPSSILLVTRLHHGPERPAASRDPAAQASRRRQAPCCGERQQHPETTARAHLARALGGVRSSTPEDIAAQNASDSPAGVLSHEQSLDPLVLLEWILDIEPDRHAQGDLRAIDGKAASGC